MHFTNGSIKKPFASSFLHQRFGQLTFFFLGIEVSNLENGIVLSQKRFTNQLLRDCGIQTFKRVVTPLPLNLKLHLDSSSPFHDPTLYRSLVGKLNFLTNTRPDLAFTVQSLSQFMQAPSTLHYDALVHTSYIELSSFYCWARYSVESHL